MTAHQDQSATYAARARELHGDDPHEEMDAEAVDVFVNAAVALEESGVRDTALNVGDVAPNFALPDSTGAMCELREHLRTGPVIVSFYRGGWCPFCNLELRVLHEYLPRFHSEGASLIAVSPHTPEASSQLVDTIGLEYPVLSDPGCSVADKFGITFDVIPEQAAYYREQGLTSEDQNGVSEWRLPAPATFVIATDQLIEYAYINLDFTSRAEPAEIIEAVRRARTRVSGALEGDEWT